MLRSTGLSLSPTLDTKSGGETLHQFRGLTLCSFCILSVNDRLPTEKGFERKVTQLGLAKQMAKGEWRTATLLSAPSPGRLGQHSEWTACKSARSTKSHQRTRSNSKPILPCSRGFVLVRVISWIAVHFVSILVRNAKKIYSERILIFRYQTSSP